MVVIYVARGSSQHNIYNSMQPYHHASWRVIIEQIFSNIIISSWQFEHKNVSRERFVGMSGVDKEVAGSGDK